MEIGSVQENTLTKSELTDILVRKQTQLAGKDIESKRSLSK